MRRTTPRSLVLPLLFFLLAFLTQGVSSQEAKTGTGIGIGGEIGFQFLTFTPGLNINVVVPINFNDENLTLTPYIGFAYLFAVREDLHAAVYIPLGAKLGFTKYGFGIRFDYYLSLREIFRHGIFNLSVFGNFPIIQKDHFNLAVDFNLGASLLYRDTYGARLLVHLQPSLSAWYAF